MAFRQRRSKSQLVLSISFVLSGFCAPATLLAQGSLSQKLSKTLAATPQPGVKTSACVIDLATGQVVLERSADQPLTPASSQKVIAIATALLELGPDFAFSTKLATDGNSLYVIGDGDPGFGDPNLARDRGESIYTPFRKWSAALRSAGHGSFAGGIVLDESIFDDEQIHPTWEVSDLGKWYAAPIGAINFNDNCLEITVRPAKRAGALAHFDIVPDAGVVNVINECKTGGRKNPTLHHPPGTFDYILRGGCRKKWTLQSVAFPDPGLLFAETLRKSLERDGMSVRGGLRRERTQREDGTLAKNIDVLATYETPLVDALARAGKNSQNFFAECLLKRAGFARMRRVGRPNPSGSWASGAIAAQAMFERAKINRHGLVIADGSGLSRTNRVTARQLAELLAWSAKTPFGPYLHDSLARGGVDGSLRKRMKDTRGRVSAKTGTMRGVCALAGYVDGDTDPRYAFAIIFNDYNGPSTPYRKIQDLVCKTLMQAAKP